MKQTLQLFLLILCGALSLGSHAQSAPEVLYLQTVPSVSGCAGSEANDVVTIWSNSPQNLTVTRTFYTSADCGGEPSSATTFEITPLGISTPVRLKITLPLGMKSCKFNVVSQSNLSTSACLPLTVNPFPSRLYVNASASGANTGLTWADAFTDLQSALSYPCSSNLTEIWVAGGTYKPTADASGNPSPANARTKTFVMKNGVAIYGGFNGTETQLSARNWRSNPTILSGNIGDTGIDTDNSYRVINNTFTSGAPLTNTAILDGFIVEKGYADQSPSNLGGGMWNTYASPVIRNCVFRNNYAAAGGGVFNDNSQATIENCLFVTNSVSVAGAALSNGGGTDQVKVVNCTFYGNTGSTITINNQSSVPIINCIVWGNGGGISGGTVTYSNVQGGVSGTGNISLDPRFVNAAGGDFRLQQCSPAIDAGTATNVPTTDFEGNSRVDAIAGSGVVDMGAYEYQATYDVCSACLQLTGSIVYVNASASGGSNNGSSWANAFTDLQSALTIAHTYPSCVTQIWVAKGTYKPHASDPNVYFSMVNGVTIYGGFPNDGTGTMANRNWNANPTILSGDLNGDDTFAGTGTSLVIGNVSDNSYLVIRNGNTTDNTARLDGFIVSGANNKLISGSGGGVYNDGNNGICNPVFMNCVFRHNLGRFGGAVSNEGNKGICNPTFTHCLFYQNQAINNSTLSLGGAMYCLGNVTTVLSQCTFSQNKSSGRGGAIRASVNFGSPNVTLRNCILWDNTAATNGNHLSLSGSTLSLKLDHTLLQGGTGAIDNSNSTINNNGGLLDANPLFVDAGNGDLRLQQCSPAIDAGTSTDAPTTDLDGNNRVDAIAGGGVVDMGAYEYQATYDVCAVCANTTGGIVYVNASASGGSNNGSSWANAFTDLQSALALARTYPSCVSQIWVAKGTYKPTSGSERGISFSMVNGVAIYGGFPNDGTGTMANRNWNMNPTILSGNIGAEDNNGDNSYRVISNINNGLTTANSLLDGFTIRDGNANNTSNNIYGGGGMYNEAASPGLNNLIFMENQALLGAGMYNQASSPVLNNVVFSSNRSVGDGGGMYNSQSSPVLNSVIFLGNQAYSGGGININLSSPILNNVTFLGNQASKGGGMFLSNGSRPILTNVTFSGNQATDGGGICNYASNPILKNCILWGNGSEVANFEVTNPTYTYCLIQGMNPTGTGNLDGTLSISNPLFVSQPMVGLGATGNLRLQQCSPAINAGDPTTTSATVGNMDLGGNPRFYNNGRVDIGAYEYQLAPPTAITPTVGTSNPTTCGGAEGSITLSGFLNNTTYSVSYKKNSVAVSVANFTSNGSGIVVLTGLGSGNYTETVATYGGCVSNAVTATLEDPATPTATIANNNSPICSGNNATFSVNGTTGATLTYTLTGLTGNQTLLLDGTNQTISATNATADVTLTLVSVTKNNCLVSLNATSTVTVNPLPTATIASNNSPICAGNNATFSVSGTTGATLTYTLTGLTGNQTLLLDGTTQTIMANNATADATLTLVSVTKNNCLVSLTATSTVTVNPLPTATVANNNSPICSGNTATFSVSGTTGATLTYTLTGMTGNQTLLLDGTTQTILATNATADVTLTLVSVTKNNCLVSLIATSTVTVNPSPTATIANNNSPICAGNNATFSVSGTTGATLTYTLTGLTGNQTLLLDGTTQTITANNATTDVMLTLVSVTKNNCLVSLTATSTVTVNPLPTATIANNNSPICSGSNATFSVSGTTGATLTYTLTGLTGNQTLLLDGTTQTITAPNATVDVTLTLVSVTKNNCLVSLNATSTVTVNPSPTATIASNNSPICSGNNATFSVSGTTGATLTYTLTGLTGNQTLLLDGTTQTITANNATTDVMLTLVSVTKNNCLVSLTATSTVTVNPLPTATIGSNNSPICLGNTATFSVSGTTGATLTYTLTGLTGNQTLLLDGTTQTITATNATADVMLTLVSVTKNNCLVSLTATSTVTVNPLPTATIANNNSPICAGNNATFSVSGTTGATLTYTLTGLTGNQTLLLDGTTQTITAPNATADATLTLVSVTKNNCLVSLNATSTVTVNPSPTATIAGTTTVCKNATSPKITFTGAGGTTPYTFTYKINNGSEQTIVTTSGSSVSLEAPTGQVGIVEYSLVSVKDGSLTLCSQVQTGSATVTVQGKPTITLTTLQQTLNEGNSQTFCDTDANPVNGLLFTVSGLCVVGNPVWRVQVGSGAWSEWMTNSPVSQLSNNQPYRYQAACDANCAVTYTSPIELTINYRSTVPQNVSLLVDGVSVAVGETKEVCSLVNMPLSFTTNCGANEVVLYSVDGGEYSAGLPVGLVDNQYHNYRVRCRQSGGVASCVESESGVMRLKLVVIPSAPTVSLSSTGSCNSGSSFSGQSSCGSLRTVWYNASTNVALPSLPSTVPSQTTSYYARCQTENGCVSEKSNVVTFTLTPTQVAPIITVSQEIVCTGTTVKISANCPVGSQTFWNTGVTASSFEVAFSNVTKQTYWAKCLFEGGCQSAESIRKDVYWNAFVVTLINIGESKSAVKVNDRSAWSSQFITRDGGPELEQSTQVNPTLYYVENANKQAPRYWTINVEACGLNTDGSLTFDMLATPEMGIIRSFNTHENNAPYFMYANREGWTELYAQNHPAYGFYQDNGAGGNSYDAGLPKGLYKLGIRYWDQKGWGSIYPSTRKPQGNVLAYQEYWFRIQSKDGVGVGAAREGANGSGQVAKGKWQWADNGKQITDNGSFATVLPNPVTNTLRLQIQNSKGQLVQTTLSDAAGRDVLSRQFVPETNTHQEEFGVSALPTGMYFLKVATSEKQATLKVVKVE